MQPHEERVVGEKKELDEKIERLASFLNGETYEVVDVTEQFRLKMQLEVMRLYSSILADRIAAFP